MDMAQSKKISTKKNAANKMSALSKSKATGLVEIRIVIMVLVELVIGLVLNYLRKSDMMVTLRFHQHVLPVLRYVFAAFALAAAAYFIITVVKNIDTSAHVVTPFMLFAIAMSFAVTAAFFDRFLSAPYLFWIAAAIVCVFFALYYVYTVLMYKK